MDDATSRTAGAAPGESAKYIVAIQIVGGCTVMSCPQLGVKSVEYYSGSGNVDAESVRAALLKYKPWLNLKDAQITISDQRVTCDWDEIQKRKKEGRGRDAGSLRAPKF